MSRMQAVFDSEKTIVALLVLLGVLVLLPLLFGYWRGSLFVILGVLATGSPAILTVINGRRRWGRWRWWHHS